MLVLTRKANQSIMIGDGIEISVLAIMGERRSASGSRLRATCRCTAKRSSLEIQKEQDVGAKDAREEVDAALRGLSDPE